MSVLAIPSNMDTTKGDKNRPLTWHRGGDLSVLVDQDNVKHLGKLSRVH